MKHVSHFTLWTLMVILSTAILSVTSSRTKKTFSSLKFGEILDTHVDLENQEFICETSILIDEIFEEGHASISDRLRPRVLLTSIALLGNNATSGFSYEKEFEEEDIFNSNRLGTRLRTPNCATLFLETSNSTLDLTLSLISSKYGRPHKDFFVFFGSVTFITKLNRDNTQFRDIRYKYGFNSMSLEFHNFCAISKNTLPVFSRRCDSHVWGHHIRAVASKAEPFVHFGMNKLSRERMAGGIMFSLLHESSIQLNFTFDLRYAGFLGSSGFKRNGTWYGAVGEVFKQEADIALTAATTVFRFPMNDPGVTICYVRRYFYILSPPLGTSWDSIFWPLTLKLWLLIGGFVSLVVIPSYYLMALGYYRSYSVTSVGNLFILNQLIYSLWKIFIEQSLSTKAYKFTRMRLMLFLWAYFSLVITTGYRSKLINFLTFLEREPVPTTHEQLSLSDYKLFFRSVGGGVAYQYVANSSEPRHKRILKRAVLVNSSTDGLFQTLFEDRAAWLDYRINADFAIDRYATINPIVTNNPLFLRSEDYDYYCHIPLSFRKGSPLIESFDRVVLHILSAGLYAYYQAEDGYYTRVEGAVWVKNHSESRIQYRIAKVLETLTFGPKSLNRRALSGLFLVLFSGLLAGLLIWFIEIDWKSTKRKRQLDNPNKDKTERK